MNNIRTIRKEVTTMANKLNKRIKNLSVSFKRAWNIIKCKKLICKVAGVTFGSRQTALKRLENHSVKGSNINVTLERETENKADRNAVKVIVSVNSSAGYHLGYLPKEAAEYIAPIIDKLGELKAKFIDVVGGCKDKPLKGCRIEIEF